MKLISLLLLFQVLLFSAAPVLALVPGAACCAVACEEEAHDQPQHEEHAEGTEARCNPFGCAGCCTLMLTTYYLNPASPPAVLNTDQVASFVANPLPQSQWGIWHPPRQG